MWMKNKYTATFSIIAILLLAGATSATKLTDSPMEWQEKVKTGLIRIATYKHTTSAITATEAKGLLNNWYSITVTCTEPTEQMWMQYCQNLYMENMAIDCNAVSASDKETVMNNMRVCSVR